MIAALLLAQAVFFSPLGGCTDAIVKELNAAKRMVLIQSYSFTSQKIIDAVVAAENRGVTVRVILDPGTIAVIPKLIGVQCFVDRAHPLMHDKVMVIDARTVMTGSFNFSAQAEHNAENLLIIHNGRLAQIYATNWNLHFTHSTASP